MMAQSSPLYMNSTKLIHEDHKNSKTWLTQFQNTFLYGQEIQVLHKGKPKYMTVYLDNNNEKFLWVSSKTKAFLLDLYFTTITFDEIQQLEKLVPKVHYFSLHQFSDEVVMIFETEKEQMAVVKNFHLYIDQLKQKYPQYCAYFSHVDKKFSMESTKTGGGMFKAGKQILEFSKEISMYTDQENQRILNHVTNNNKKKITFERAREYFNILFCSTNLKPVFEQYSEHKLGDLSQKPTEMLVQAMSRQQFKRFLQQCQDESPQRIQSIIEKMPQDLSFFDFCFFLYDEEFCYICHSEIVDESRPLNDYFCYSSHNTYLSGNQLTSDSKVTRYIEDLQNGIKCVELDVHNDGDIPIVTHAINGQGFCKPILFEDVIRAIDRFSQYNRANQIQHYPIILSIENHASEQNKQKMLNILLKYFNDDLYRVDENDEDFPSLEKLKGKIVVKTSNKEQELRKMMPKDDKVKNQSDFGAVLEFSLHQLNQSSSRTFDNIELEGEYQKFLEFRKIIQKQKISFTKRMNKMQQLFLPVSSLAKITAIFKAQQGIKTQGSSPFECTSLTNVKVMKTKKQDIIQYSKRSWLRTYPIGTEVASDNYDPVPMFEVGAQIVALNTQNKDSDAWITHGYFSSGRFCSPGMKGYVLKPPHLLPHYPKPLESKTFKISIKIVVPNGYEVKMKFRGTEEDNSRNKDKQQEFIVKNLDEGFIIFNFGQRFRECIALRFLAIGYRVIQVKNKENYLDTGGRVIVRVDKKEI